MRARTFKTSAGRNESSVDARRAKGREAQRRYRLKINATLASLERNNDLLEHTLQEISASVIDFSNLLLRKPQTTEIRDLTSAWKDVISRCLLLKGNAESSKNYGHMIQYSAPTSRESQHELRRSQYGPDTSAVPEKPAAEDELCDEYIVANASKQEMSRPLQRIPQTVMPLLTQNPLLSEDYLALEQPVDLKMSFSELLHRSAAIETYRCLVQSGLNQHKDGTISSSRNDLWLHSAHQFTLLFLDKSSLLNITRSALDSIHNAEEELEAMQLPLKLHAQHRQLAGLVRQAMSTSTNFDEAEWLSSADLEAYLRSHRMFRSTSLEILLSIHVPRFPDRNSLPGVHDPRTVLLDTRKFIKLLMSQSICIGDGVWVRKDCIKPAVRQALWK